MSTNVSQPKYFAADQVAKVLTWNLVNSAVEEALKATGITQANSANAKASYAIQPARSVTPCGDYSKLLLTMPGFVGNYQLSESGDRINTLACKLVTSFSSNQNLQPPLPNILANILLFCPQTGQLRCIIDGTQITGWRTASASIVATKYLFLKRFPQAKEKPIKVALIGCGVQGQSHALGMCKTYNVIDIFLWNRTKSKAENLASKLRAEFRNGLKVHVSERPQDAVQDADVICVGTYSPNALISYSMLKDGDIHINTVGAGQVHFGEVGQDIYDNAVVYVDSLVSAKTELKDLKATIIGEVGEVIRNEGQRTENNRITIFQSMGIAAEDATVAQAVYNALNK
ncbi:ketimine reductase mu-crystallin [Stomoxys calcitrans]|uniref:ketimine reductase mu-crystallin n=1 Tax=Stomoxys calcitrans TaxID=35570 RepID=UPI0027E22045|nr:ketimine reductase mu-crystallin [Stomoxys calcitrans]